MDIRPVTRCHLLVVPKKHSADLSDTDEATLNDVVNKTKKIAQAAMDAVKADGFTVSTNKGTAAGQTVFHLHFHVIPRFTKDGLPPWPHHEIEPKTRTEIAEQIKKNL